MQLLRKVIQILVRGNGGRNLGNYAGAGGHMIDSDDDEILDNVDYMHADIPLNNPPVFETIPSKIADEKTDYIYDITVSDADGEPVLQ